jgi:hypothetical protein
MIRRAVSANRDILLGVKVQIGSNMQGRYGSDFRKGTPQEREIYVR